MKLYKFLLPLLLFSSFCLKGQEKLDYNWVFGFNSSSPTVQTSLLGFNNDTVIVNVVNQSLNISASNGTISSENGDLQFYTNGCEIFNAELNQIENGFDLNAGDAANQECEFGYNGWPQSMIILPSDINQDLYHIIHKRIIYDFSMTPFVVVDSVLHSIVDMSKNNGNGEVVQKNKPINSFFATKGNLAAVKNSNGGWWIVSSVRDSNLIEIYELSGDEIVDTKIEITPDVILESDNDLQAKFSSDGNYYFRAVGKKGIYMYAFDRSIGSFTSVEKIDFTINTTIGGFAISSNSRFIYINNDMKIWQFDLNASNIEESKVLIAEYDGYESPSPSTFFQGQIGPDCKIYYNSEYSVDVLHVIHNPNVKGKACNFEQHGIQLGSRHGISIPYFPHYRMDSDFPICDTTRLTSTSISNPSKILNQINISPNPSSSGFYHMLSNESNSGEFSILVHDIFGTVVFSKKTKDYSSFEIDISQHPAGFYFLSVINKSRIIHGEKIIRIE